MINPAVMILTYTRVNRKKRKMKSAFERKNSNCLPFAESNKDDILQNNTLEETQAALTNHGNIL